MQYQVKITKPAEKRLKKFDKHIQKIFAKKIDKIKTNPKMFLKPLKSHQAGQWEYYFEKSFRILFRVYEKDKILIIEAIKHKNEL